MVSLFRPMIINVLRLSASFARARLTLTVPTWSSRFGNWTMGQVLAERVLVSQAGWLDRTGVRGRVDGRRRMVQAVQSRKVRDGGTRAVKENRDTFYFVRVIKMFFPALLLSFVVCWSPGRRMDEQRMGNVNGRRLATQGAFTGSRQSMRCELKGKS